MGLARIRIVTDGPTGTIEINGEKVEYVAAVQFRCGLHELPEVWLRVHADVELEGDGVVKVAAGDADVDRTAIITEFLDHIDPDTLEREVLNGLGMGDKATPAMLAKLKEYAGGGS